MLFTAAAAALLAATALETGATPPETIRFERRSLFPWPSNEWTSHRGTAHWGGNPFFGWQVFSSFTLDMPEIVTRLRWVGSYEDYEDLANNPQAENTLDWTVSIHADADGQPGAELFSEQRAASEVVATPLGIVRHARDQLHLRYHEFDFALSEPFRLEAGTRYWVSVVSEGATFKPIFVWVGGAADRDESRLPLNPQSQPSEDSWQVAIEENTNADPGRRAGSRAITLIGHPADDTDEDGMDDSWEAANGLDPSVDDRAGDPDEDGATNLEEFERRSDPRDPDTDDDGLPDGVETNSGTWVGATDSGTSPLLPDTDRDGLIDSLERPGIASGEDPAISPSDPNRPDTDLDSFGDAVEHSNGFDPVSPESFPEPIVRGIGPEALIGGDLTDPEDDAEADSLEGLDLIIDSNEMPPGVYDLFDNRLGTSRDMWCCGQAGDEARVILTFDEPIVLTHFTIASGSSSRLIDPRHWAIRGSNDGGDTWENIYTRWNFDEAVWTERLQVLEYRAGLHYLTPPAYRMIRFHSLGSNRASGSNFQLGELELFGRPHRLEFTRMEPGEHGGILLEWSSIPGDQYSVDQSEDLQTWLEVIDGLESEGSRTRFNVEAFPEPRPRRLYFRVRRQ